MKWIAAGFEDSLAPVLEAFGAAAWPAPPAGFAPVGKVRAMRQVVRGTVEGPEGPLDLAIKWSRPVTSADRVARIVRGGKGPREGRVLRALQRVGVAVPPPLAFASAPADVLVTLWLEDLEPAPAPAAATPTDVNRFAALVAALHDAGVRHRDLSEANVGMHRDAPILIDAGGSRVGPPLARRARVTELARIANGWLRTARRALRLRALRAYMQCWGETDVRAMELEVTRRARALRRRFLTGRDRRPKREGRHFRFFAGGNVAQGVRAALLTDEAFENAADAWLLDDPADAEPLKEGGRVLRVRSPAGSGSVVLKRFDATAKGRLPYALRALRRAEAFRHRHLPVPRALMAVVGIDGQGLLVSEAVDAPNLHAYMTEGAYAALDVRAQRRFLRLLGRTLRLMHDADVSHRDLKAPNLLVPLDAAGDPTVAFADLEGARIRRRPVPWTRRARDLARLDASLAANRTDRMRVMRAYLAVPPWPDVDLRALLDEIAGRVARKRGPSGRPR
ncbi:MAG: lipopolysaccharide kinase InaA family protein [Planctomycetota bacterium]|nr:lipopolysaccharide kinase InaA family protein [Planctomycetota bacterium]